jgi:BirA family biotin operon repressor/biotin-[acetyl-CoA-carboxylase] ligase
VILAGVVASTQDLAHDAAAAGAPAGTLVIADAQTAGRGRQGRRWRSDAGSGVWCTMIERPDPSAESPGLLSLRAGLAIATALGALAGETVMVKWPNDLILRDRKLGGILVEMRWRDGRPEWVAIGVGINLLAPEGEARAIGLGGAVRRQDVLAAIVPPLRVAAAANGELTSDERGVLDARDWLRGRRCIEPVAGIAGGIDPSGALLIAADAGVVPVRAGSIVLEEERST